MVLVVGFIILIAFILAAITYANMSQRNGGGIFGIASKSTSKTSQLTVNACADNTEFKALIVEINKRHMWACTKTKSVYDAPVITGKEYLPENLTPKGVYHIYEKQTNLYLNGSDSTGNWHDYVYYWMPFLSNKYGVYGFHDADTWRKPTEYGNIDPNSPKASHGCVESTRIVAKWIYDWAPIGTTVIIKS